MVTIMVMVSMASIMAMVNVMDTDMAMVKKSKHPLCYAMSAYRYYFITPYIPLHKGSTGTP